jgi:hypothetical protein
MFKDEHDMLTCRMEAFADAPGEVRHVFTESQFTHRGVRKLLNFPVLSFAGDPEVRYVAVDWEPDRDPWVNEHVQRNAAWKVIDAEAADDDAVLIMDVDEIPNGSLLAWLEGPGREALENFGAVSVAMKTFLFAVDWVCPAPLPPTCVAASVAFLRRRAAEGAYLAEVRDRREDYPVFEGGGWHFSWCGGVTRQRQKLLTATCHTEIMKTPEAELILSGARWRSDENGGGLPVVPVEIDDSYPAYVREGRCPPSWFRPRPCWECGAGKCRACGKPDLCLCALQGHLPEEAVNCEP